MTVLIVIAAVAVSAAVLALAFGVGGAQQHKPNPTARTLQPTHKQVEQTKTRMSADECR